MENRFIHLVLMIFIITCGLAAGCSDEQLQLEIEDLKSQLDAMQTAEQKRKQELERMGQTIESLTSQLNVYTRRSYVYRDFSLGMDWRELPDRYPRSGHSIASPDDGKQYYRGFDGTQNFNDIMDSGYGNYTIRLSRDESHDYIYYVHMSISRSMINLLRISFEMRIIT